MSLTAQEPPRYVEEIDCTDIHPFKTIQEATLYAKLKGNYMVIKDADSATWYVMPSYNGVLVGGCLEEN